MTCPHLYPLEKELLDAGFRITFRGQAWSENCREWVYFDCLFSDLPATMQRLSMDSNVVKIHDHYGTHDGQEYGLICDKCQDGIMGLHPKTVGLGNRAVVRFT